MLAAAVLLLSTQGLIIQPPHASAPGLRHTPTLARTAAAVSLEQIQRDLRRDDWQPLQTDPAWRNPCLLTSLLTAVSVQQAVAFDVWPLFGLGPLLVLLSSIIYWSNPQRDTWRRTLDLVVVRGGMASQILIGCCFCRPLGVVLLLAGYAAGGVCYAAGRVLTVREQRVRGAWVHTGVHVFANLGNLLLLRFVR